MQIENIKRQYEIEKLLDNMKNKITNLNYLYEVYGGKTEEANIQILYSLPSINLFLCELDGYKGVDLKERIERNLKLACKFSKIRNDVKSMYSGLANIGISCIGLKGKYNDIDCILNDIKDIVLKQLNQYINQKKELIDISDIELIQGLSGMARYLLFYKDESEARKTLDIVLGEIVKFINIKKTIGGREIVSWFVEPKDVYHLFREEFPNGYADLGMAHGLTGILSILSICYLNGVEVKGQKKAIEYGMNELYKFKIQKDNKIFWPGRIPYEMLSEESKDFNFECPSWCYGLAGMSRAVFLAGKVLDNPKYIYDSINGMKMLIKSKTNYYDAPIFCHGYAGLMYSYYLMYRETNDPEFIEGINDSIEEILYYYDENKAFYFKEKNNSKRKVHDKFEKELNFLDGIVSILLPLSALVKEKSTEWDSVYLFN